MKIEIKRVTDWQRVVDAARFTQRKEPLGHEPSDELKKAYESKKDSLAKMANSSWAKLLNEYIASKNKEDGVDAKLPDIDELIKKLASDEFIEKKINDVLGDDNVELKEK